MILPPSPQQQWSGSKLGPQHLRGVGAYIQEHDSYSPVTHDLRNGPVGYDDDYVRLEYRLPYEMRRLIHNAVGSRRRG